MLDDFEQTLYILIYNAQYMTKFEIVTKPLCYKLYSDLYMVKLVRHILNDLYAVIKTFKNREILQ